MNETQTKSDQEFVAADLRDVPEPLERAAAAALRRHSALQAESFAPIAAAMRRVVGKSFGNEVEFLTWRAAAPVRYRGMPALLVAQLDVVDAAVDPDAVTLSIVEGAGATEAGAAARGETAATLLPS